MKTSFLQHVFSIVRLVSVVVMAWIAAPYILTSEHYESDEGVHPRFPIILLEEDRKTVIEWRNYVRSPEKYSSQLVTPSEEVRGKLADMEFFTLSRSHAGTYLVEHRANNYTFWSEYSIEKGQVKPIRFRSSDAIVVSLVVGSAVLVLAVFDEGMALYRRRRSGQGNP